MEHQFSISHQPRILVVDDEPDMCWALENILCPAGYAVTTTTSGAEAIEKAQERFFNLALMDIRLPDVEGIELVAPLKAMHPDMAVIMVTGYASLETAVRALNEGVLAYLTKPLNLDEVLATARKALEKQRLVEEKQRAEQQLAYMATHDALTGLPNRVLFNDRLTMALAHAHRNQRELAVMLLDLDHFKDVNDTLGHSVGDQLLQTVGDRLMSLLRKSDTVARMGGDEFMLILSEIPRVEDTAKIAQKILEAFRKPFVFDGHELHVTTSIGIAIYPYDGKDADMLMKNVDVAMYRAKNQGRDNYQYYSRKGKEEMGEQASILIVDDEPDMCWALENILRPAGYTVTTTTSGAEALELVARQHFAVAFVDAKLPDLDGLELAALIRQQSPHTAIVLISGYFYQEDKAITEGLQDELFIGFMAKPFDLDEIRRMARQAVERAEE